MTNQHNVAPGIPVTTDVSAAVPAAVPGVVPTVSILGCGGFGINIARAVRAAIGDIVTYHNFDTSDANVLTGEPLTIVAGGRGAGQVRSTLSKEIEKTLLASTADELYLSNINIVINSLGGGSGSVIGPLLARTAVQRETRVIEVALADTASEKYTENSLSTLQTLSAIATNNDIYLPMMLFSNDNMARTDADQSIVSAVVWLVRLLTIPVREIDWSDRINWLNASKTVGVPAGLRLLHVYADVAGISDGQPFKGEVWFQSAKTVYDSVLSIGVEGRDSVIRTVAGPKPLARFFKQGTATAIKLAPMCGLISGDPTPITELIKKIQEIQRIYKATPTSSLADVLGVASGSGDIIF